MRESAQTFDPRQTMRRQDFEVFHYKNTRQGNVAVHHHDFYEVYFFLGGRVEYRVEGQIFRLQPGDLLLINPEELHQANVESGDAPYERIVLWIDKVFLEGFRRGEDSLSRCFDGSLPTHSNLLRPAPAQRTELTMLLGELVRERYSRDYASEMYAMGIFVQFMAELNRLALQAQPGQRREESSALIPQVLQHIAQHYDEELSLEELAQRFYVSKYHLSHEFSRLVGTSLYRYVMLKRLLIARQMLAGGEAPGAVCTKCGFGDYANFYRAFKAQYGISPKDCVQDRG